MSEEMHEQRGKTHGDVEKQAGIAEWIKSQLRQGREWERLKPVQRQSLDMIAVKMSRIVCGDPNEPDHWKDIAGYALLPVREKK